jgi:hypothetical protein
VGRWAQSARRCQRRQPLLPGLEVLHRRITPPSQGGIDTLQHEIMDFDPLVEGDLPQRFIDRLWQVQARVYDRGPLGRRTGRAGCAISPWRLVAFLSGLGEHCSQEKGYYFVMLWR